MAFDNTFTAVVGATYTAAQYNTYTKGNFTAIWVGTTAGDIDYYTGASAKARLALVPGGVLYGGASAPAYSGAGAAGQILQFDTLPFWGALVKSRQGGNASNWSTQGTTNYAPTGTRIEGGVRSVSISTGSGSRTITYSSAFTERPIILLCGDNSSGTTRRRPPSASCSTGATRSSRSRIASPQCRSTASGAGRAATRSRTVHGEATTGRCGRSTSRLRRGSSGRAGAGPGRVIASATGRGRI